MFASEKVKANKNLLPPYYSPILRIYPFFLREKKTIEIFASGRISDPVDPLSSIPFFKDVNPSVDKTHPTKMKLSADFLAASTPSSSVGFPFGRQAKLQQ
jgi:hypothetical protein